jgi:hypothetical protein
MWGFHKAPDNEKVHVNYCKRISNVRTSTPNITVYYELGRYPLIVTRKIRIFKFWMKLLNANNYCFLCGIDACDVTLVTFIIRISRSYVILVGTAD